MRRVFLLVSVAGVVACAKGGDNLPETVDSSVADVVGIEIGGDDATTDASDATVAETAGDAADGGAGDATSDAADSSITDAQLLDAAADAYDAADAADAYDAYDATDTFDAGPWTHTISIDGNKDFFDATEKFTTTTGAPANLAHSAWITWDSSFVYVAYEGESIGVTPSATKWLFVIIDSDYPQTVGSVDIEAYRTQRPKMPNGFYADHYLRWKTDDSFLGIRSYSGTTTGWTNSTMASGLARNRKGAYVEFAIPRTLFPASPKIGLVSLMMNETDGTEWSWAGLYGDNFVDGYYNATGNPLQLTKFLEIDFASQLAPNAAGRKRP